MSDQSSATQRSDRRSGWLLFAIGVVLVWIATNITWGKEHWRDVMQVDACGYYAWLPSLILYDDPEFHHCDTLHFEADPARVYDFRVEHNGRSTNKYFVGTAIAEAPFFLAAHAWARMSGAPTTGYSDRKSVV